MENQIHTSLEVRYHEPERLPASAGIKWITDAFGIFKLHPWKWIGVVLIYIIAGLVASIVDFLEIDVLSSLKNIVLGWMGICLLGGVMFVAHRTSNHNIFNTQDFFIVFQHKKMSFFILYLLQMLFGVIVGSLILPMFFLTDRWGGVAILPFMSLISYVALILFLLTPALIVLDDMNAWDAIKANFKAVIRNIPAILVFTIGMFILFFLFGALIGVLDGWIISVFLLIFFLPLCVINLLLPYAVYRSIYPNGRVVKS